LKIKNILVSQPSPVSGKSPYFDLAEKNHLKIGFRQFINVEGITVKEFRQTRIRILEHSAVIFTSKKAIDHFFRIAEEMRTPIPDDMKYFCVSENVALYLQKYIVYRKRKIFPGKGRMEDLIDLISKNRGDKFLCPVSDSHNDQIPTLLKKHKITFTKSVFYKTVCCDLSDLVTQDYDVIVFYSPVGIKSLIHNFPDFKQNGTFIASFGKSTANAVKKAGLRLDIEAPNPKAPSMTMALEQFIVDYNKNH